MGIVIHIHRDIEIPAAITDGNTVAWYDSTDLTTITKDGGNLVSQWDDKLGSGHDLIQAVAGSKPTFMPTGILFDGVGDFMITAGFTLAQPEMIYMVFKQITWTLNCYIFDGIVTNRGIIYQNPVTHNISQFAGLQTAANNNLPLDTFGIARVLFNGASSSFQIDATTPVTGNVGANDMGGFTLGGRGGTGNAASNIEVKEVIIRKVVDSAQDEADIYNYLVDKYGL